MDDRYSRLKALEEYGYPVDWSLLHSKTVTIAGVGGLGSITAEIMTRVGVGEIYIFDLDIVEEANLNRLIFTEDDIGKNKVDAIKDYLLKVNPNVMIHAVQGDIMAFENEDDLEDALNKSDAGLLCLDNVPARQYFNVKAVDNQLPYMDAGLLRSGMGGYVHLTIPGKTACYQCTGTVKITKTNDTSGQQCTASLPTVVNIIASLQAHQLIKYMLKFGDVPDYVSYNAFTDGVVQSTLAKDPDCYVCGEL